MDKSFSISARGILLAGLVLLALLTAYVLGGAGDPPGTPARADDNGAVGPRQLTMVGSGTATAVPDQVSFTVSVNVLDPELETALDTSSATMDRVLGALKDFGVTKKDMQTTGLSMNPEYDYPNSAPPVLKGYRVTQKARVRVPELARAGKAITATVKAGGNRVRVGSISLGLSDRESFLAQARRSAVEQARTKAEEYADASGQQLGDVLTLKEVATSVPQVELRNSYRTAAEANADAVPIRAGEDELQVRVQVVWELR